MPARSLKRTLAICRRSAPVSSSLLSAGATHRGGEAAYEKILARDPYFTPATRQLAMILARKPGNNQKAYDLAIKAHEAFPDDPGVETALGIMHYRMGDYPAAVTLLQEGLRKRADDGEALSYLGMSHLGLKQTKEARDELQRSLALKLPAGQADRVKRILDDMKSHDTGEQGSVK